MRSGDRCSVFDEDYYLLCGSSYAILSDVERSYVQPFRRRSGSGTFQEIFPHSSRTTTGADSQRAPRFLPVNPNPTRRRHLFPFSSSCPPLCSAAVCTRLLCLCRAVTTFPGSWFHSQPKREGWGARSLQGLRIKSHFINLAAGCTSAGC